MLRVCVAKVGNVKDGVFSLKLESVMKIWVFIVTLNVYFWGNLQGALTFADKTAWCHLMILLYGHKIFYRSKSLFMKTNLSIGLLSIWDAQI